MCGFLGGNFIILSEPTPGQGRASPFHSGVHSDKHTLIGAFTNTNTNTVYTHTVHTFNVGVKSLIIDKHFEFE